MFQSKCKPVKVSGCESCYFKRHQFVGPRGNPEAPIVFVGESPGSIELVKGLPFVGPSGKVLTDCLPEDMSEDDYYITNALQCLPRKGADANKNTTELQHAATCCRNRLLEEIKAHPRKVIVALGNGALWSLTNNPNYKITRARGKLFPSDLSERGIVASVHPAFLLRGGGSYRKFRSDIEYALDLADGLPEKKPVIPTWCVAETERDVRDFIDYTLERAEIVQDEIVAADVETGGFDHRQDEMLCLGWSIEPDEIFIVPEALLETDVLKYRSFDKGRLYKGPLKWCWHNGKFDIKFMRMYGFRSTVDHDTMLMSYSMEEQRGFHDLEQVAADEIGAPDYKGMLKPYLPKKTTSYRVIPKDVLHKYLALDVSNTKQIQVRMLRRVKRDEKTNKLYHRVLLPASELLAGVENNGMRVDFGRVEENAIYYQEIMAEHGGVLDHWSKETGGTGINPNSPLQLSALLYDRLKLSKRKKGTGEEVLKKLPQHPAVKALLAYRKAAKAYGTYVKSLHDQVSDDGRVHSTYLIHGTTTGRLSSRGPNMQNQPRDPRIRGQFIAGEGNIYMSTDLDQAELRCLAVLSKDSELCGIYEDGRKLHKEVSIDLWGSDWVDRYALDDPGNPIFDQAKEEYMRTKALNFGIIYGREAPSIAEEFGISVREAQAMIDGWASKFPDAWDFIQKCRRAPIKGQNLLTPFGRRKRAGVVSREKLRDLQNEAANFPHQSIASDITLLSAVEAQEQFTKWKVMIVNLIHDDVLSEMEDNEDLFKAAAQHITSIMEDVPARWGMTRIPFLADAKLGIRWGDLKDASFK